MSAAQAFHAYAARGLHVLPLRPGGKAPHPVLRATAEGRRGGVYMASCDLATAERWGRLEPPPNIGVRLGVEWPPGSGLYLVVLDIDVKAAPAIAARVHEMLGDKTLRLETWVARTPSGGAHLWLLTPKPLHTARLVDEAGQHLGEMLGEGRYVVVPPSRVGSKRYDWLSSLAEDSLPKGRPLVVEDALKYALELLQQYGIAARPKGSGRPGSGPEPPYRKVINGEVVREGERHTTALSYAGKLVSLGLPQHTALACVLAARDSLFEDGSHPLTDSEVAAVVRHCATQEAAKGEAREDEAEELSDATNAKILASLLEGRALFVEGWGWCVWTGDRWRRDPSEAQVLGMARDMLPRFFRIAARLAPHPKRAAELGIWAVRVGNAARLEAALRLARSDLFARACEFDSDPWALNVPDGILDLRTGQVRERTPSDKVTKLAGASPPTDGRAWHELAPTWAGFLERVFPDPEVRSFVQRAVGYSLTGDVSEQVMFFCYGSGANGKSTFVRTIQALLGDYAGQAAPDLLVTKQGERHPTEIADLRGARFVASVEVEEGRRLAEVLVKTLTGGERLKARYMRMDFFEFEPTAKLWLVANHKPEVRGTDHALWRRILVVPFTVTIPEPERDRWLADKLRHELPGIMLWALEGLREWQDKGLAPPPAVREATEEYRAEMDMLGAWLAERTVDDHRAVTAIAALYADYQAWCSAAGETPIPTRAFGRRLSEKGYAPVKLGGGARGRRGLRLKGGGGGVGGDGCGDSGDMGAKSRLSSGTSCVRSDNPNLTPLSPQTPHSPSPKPHTAAKAPTAEALRKALEGAGAGDLLGDEAADPEPPGRCQGCGGRGDHRIVATGESWRLGCRPWPPRPPRPPPPRPPHPPRGPP